MSAKDNTKVACIVLAAGTSSRFGTTKQLARIRRKTLIQLAVDCANYSQADYAFLVLGHRASEVLEKTKVGRAQILLNKEFQRGASFSLKTSIANLPSDCKGALFMAADQPFMNKKDLDELIRRFKRSPKKIVSLSCEGEPRNPMIIPKRYFSEIMKLKGDKGAQKIAKKHIRDVILVESGDEKTFLDVDTREDLRRLRKSRS
ncbi:MAG TPA: nucleotidyltransferase family protein [Nitrososphaerales archaeon]|nr:nucleotidyltransferase family protein [Nitrososphaerales archaeon]